MPCWALGIFNISMLILYGEGSRAFLRLQEEIMRKNPDKSLLAWGPLSGSHLPVPASDVANPLCAYRPRLTFSVMKECVDYLCPDFTYLQLQHGSHLWFPDSLLAHSPKDFVCSSSVRCISHPEYMRRLQMIIPSAMLDLVVTPYGVRTFFPLLSFAQCYPELLTRYLATFYGGENSSDGNSWYLAILPCELVDEAHAGADELLAFVCCRRSPTTNIEARRPTPLSKRPSLGDSTLQDPSNFEMPVWRWLVGP